MAATICKECESKMYTRKTDRSPQASVVYICPKCRTVLYIWPDGDKKWETPGK